jgi:hypothetical protein
VPATDEYLLRLPDPGGEKNLGPSTPRAQPGELPPSVRSEVAQSPDGSTLATIATSDELAAPQPVKESVGDGVTDGRGVLAAAFGALTDPIAILVVLALVAIATAIGHRPIATAIGPWTRRLRGDRA